MADRSAPFEIADERRTLLGFLAYLRESIIVKATGVGEAEARFSPVPSGTSLLWLVKHLTMVEVAWFQHTLGGNDVRIPSTTVGAEDSVRAAVDAYRAATEESDRIVAEVPSLDTRCARRGTAPEPMSLRWLLVHMVEETARHAGHADIIREEIDGATGR